MKIKTRHILLCSTLLSTNSINFETIEYRNWLPTKLQSTKKKAVKSAPSRKIASEVKKEFKYKPVNLKETIHLYRKLAHFPESSRPIDHKKSSDILESRLELDKKHTLIPGTQISFISWSDKNRYTTGDEEITLYVKLSKQIDNLKIVSELKGEKINLKLTYKKISNLTYRAIISTSELKEGDYMNVISAKMTEKLDIASVNTFSLSREYYKFLGTKSDYISSEGNLIFESNFDIKIKGDYLMEGSLYYRNQIIGAAEMTYSLQTGNQNLILDFYGKIIYDKKVKGELMLKNISLSYVKPTLSIISSQILKSKYKSHPYVYDQFNKESFNNRVILDKVGMR